MKEAMGQNSGANCKLIVLSDGDIYLSIDSGRSWQLHSIDDRSENPIVAVSAPQGIGLDTPILVGRIDGTVRKLSSEKVLA